MVAVNFPITDDDKRAFAKALCLHIGKPWDAATAVFGGRNNPGLTLYAANVLISDPIVALEMLQLTAADKVGDFLGNKDQAARTVWEWTQDSGYSLKDKVAAMQLYCEIQGILKKEAEAPADTMPPSITYVLDPDAGIQPPNAANAAVRAAT